MKTKDMASASLCVVCLLIFQTLLRGKWSASFGAPGALYFFPTSNLSFLAISLAFGGWWLFLSLHRFCWRHYSALTRAPVVYRFPPSTFASTIWHDWVSGVEETAPPHNISSNVLECRHFPPPIRYALLCFTNAKSTAPGFHTGEAFSNIVGDGYSASFFLVTKTRRPSFIFSLDKEGIDRRRCFVSLMATPTKWPAPSRLCVIWFIRLIGYCSGEATAKENWGNNVVVG